MSNKKILGEKAVNALAKGQTLDVLIVPEIKEGDEMPKTIPQEQVRSYMRDVYARRIAPIVEYMKEQKISTYTPMDRIGWVSARLTAEQIYAIAEKPYVKLIMNGNIPMKRNE